MLCLKLAVKRGGVACACNPPTPSLPTCTPPPPPQHNSHAARTHPTSPNQCNPPNQEPTTYFHEISHNFFLNHAGRWGNNGYDDMSGAMGYCCEVRCHNAPHAHQLGWAGPVRTLTKDNWPAGQWNQYTLPAAVKDPRNFVRIWPDWSKRAAKYKLYVQYR